MISIFPLTLCRAALANISRGPLNGTFNTRFRKVAVSLTLLTVLCLIPACEKERKPENVDSATRPEVKDRTQTNLTRPSEPSTEDRLDALNASLKGQDEHSERVSEALSTELLVDAYERSDIGLLMRLNDILKERGNLNIEQIGANLMGSFSPNDVRNALDFLAHLDSPQAGGRLSAGLLAADMLRDPKHGYAAYMAVRERLEKMLFESGVGGLPYLVSRHAAKELFRTGTTADVVAILTVVATDPNRADDGSDLESWRESFVAPLSTALKDGDSDALRRYLAVIPADIRLENYKSIPESTLGASKLYDCMVLLDEMENSDSIPNNVYTRWGSSMDWQGLGDRLLVDKTASESPAKLALLKGWASQRPKLSTETLVQKNGNPALVRPAFSTWTEIDSMESSQWLATQPDGEIKQACVEELCGFLLNKGSSAEAEAWLAQLPPEARERVATTFNPNSD